MFGWQLVVVVVVVQGRLQHTEVSVYSVSMSHFTWHHMYMQTFHCCICVCKTPNASVESSTPTYCDGEKVVFRGEGRVCVPVGAAGECIAHSSGGRLDRRFLPLSLLCSTSP